MFIFPRQFFPGRPQRFTDKGSNDPGSNDTGSNNIGSNDTGSNDKESKNATKGQFFFNFDG